MDADAVRRAHRGDLDGLNFAGLVRLSFELGYGAQSPTRSAGPMTGRDINGRDEQEKAVRAYVESRGGTYAHTYVEPDTSAWKRKRVRLPDGRYGYRVIRPVLEGALEDLKAGKTSDGRRLDGIIVADIDRLTRDARHLEDAIDVVQHYGRPILDITGSLDLLTDNGRTVARMLIAAKSQQSADTSRRVRDKHRAMELAGIPTGGRRPFGWQDDKRTLDPAAAATIRDAAERLIQGAPVGAIVIDWNTREIRTPLGNRWSAQTVKSVFRNPRLCGYRGRNVRQLDPETGKQGVHVETVLDAEGKPVIGQWEPILSVEQWEAVIAVIGASVVHGRGKNSRTYLLSGTCRCDNCGRKMRAIKAHAGRVKEAGAFYYVCESRRNGGCSSGSIPGLRTDEFVTELVIQKYELEAARREARAEAQPWGRAGELEQVQRDIRELTAAWRARKITGGRYFALLPELEAEEKALQADRQEWSAGQLVAASRPLSIRADWETYSLPQRRALIEEALTAVIIHRPAAKRGWSADRVEPVWREG